MCGIAGIILKKQSDDNLTEKIMAMSDCIKHRGPDGEGFLIADTNHAAPYSRTNSGNYSHTDINYIPRLTVSESPSNQSLAFAHRRLAIIDLSVTGHQPMCDQESKYWITYNGEIYNYIELRSELKNLGHKFISESDTEVILNAYKEWGFDCVAKFNGMWAFCIYDIEKQICFASRDRLGVKPFYYLNSPTSFSFASEQKVFIKSGLLKARVNQDKLYGYLINGVLEDEENNFFDEIKELWPGNNLIYSLRTGELKTNRYFNLQNCINLKNDSLSEKQLIEKINEALVKAVKLRMRSDVEIGTCLSGGIDSSALAVIISEMQAQQPLACFTSVFKGLSINEESFANLVATQIKAKHLKVEPTLSGFVNELDELIYSQDVPIWDPSTYAQFKVMALAKQNNIKVLLDGQGADELFGGYHHHFIAKWNHLLKTGKYIEFCKEINASSKSIPGPFLFYIKEKIKQHFNLSKKSISSLLKDEFLNSGEGKVPMIYFDDVNSQLLYDINEIRLKIFLKCEDRCGMWHGVESRTPFSDDIELMKLVFSFDGDKKIKNGVSKYLLREAVKNKLPEQIYKRYDKKGFETPTLLWMNQIRPQIISEVRDANFDFVDYKSLGKISSTNSYHNKLLFKLFIFSRWKKIFA